MSAKLLKHRAEPNAVSVLKRIPGTALHEATVCKHSAMAGLLLSCEARSGRIAGAEHIACMGPGCNESLVFCPGTCADGGNPFQLNAEGVTPMDLAISTGQHNLVRLYESRALLRAEVEFKVRGGLLWASGCPVQPLVTDG